MLIFRHGERPHGTPFIAKFGGKCPVSAEQGSGGQLTGPNVRDGVKATSDPNNP